MCLEAGTLGQGGTNWWSMGTRFRGHGETESAREEEWESGIFPLPISLTALSWSCNPLSRKLKKSGDIFRLVAKNNVPSFILDLIIWSSFFRQMENNGIMKITSRQPSGKQVILKMHFALSPFLCDLIQTIKFIFPFCSWLLKSPQRPLNCFVIWIQFGNKLFRFGASTNIALFNYFVNNLSGLRIIVKLLLKLFLVFNFLSLSAPENHGMF